ncbi:MAG: NlpC/P60 family protein, partial [Lachnospiraceae bacterium]|nr:NlpC/P60 family protein [Lachnospiraceae bacterium]
QDIMSMASIYTYYHNPYDTKTYMNYCYDLMDKSYTYVASISEVYYCSGCMDYSDPNIDDRTVTIGKIPLSLYEQKVDDDIYEQKAGTLDKMDLTKITINDYTYDQYVTDIKNNGHNILHNYCPGHIDLDVTVTCRCLQNKNGLLDIDTYGNSGRNYIETWHGWEKTMVSKAVALSSKDWEQEYGLLIDKIDYLKPLPQELINYYLCTLDSDVSKDRMTLIETALRSVSRIPYYYAGKPRGYGYINNHFNERVKADYNGRVLNGLDCSGWITWVYWTAFAKKIVKNEGTVGLAKEGTRIVRSELKPGDLIVRPGYDSHVMMFLSFEEGGKVKVIHENGSVNNVSIATYEAYYPYYRKIFAN